MHAAEVKVTMLSIEEFERIGAAFNATTNQ